MGINSKEILEGTSPVGRQWESLVKESGSCPVQIFSETNPFSPTRQAAQQGKFHYQYQLLWSGCTDIGATGPIKHVPLPDVDLESLENFPTS